VRRIVLIALILALSLSVFAIEDDVLSGDCKKLDFEGVLRAAIQNSYELKATAINVERSKARLSSAKRSYIPSLTLRATTEYMKGLDNRGDVAIVGDTIINSTTRFQDSISLILQHRLMDWGILKNKVKIAKYDIEQKEVFEVQTLRDLKIKMLDLYTETLAIYLRYENLKEEKHLYEEIFKMQQRLHEAGLSSKLALSEAEINLNMVKTKIENLKLNFTELLADLSFYVGTNYGDVENISFSALELTSEDVDSLNWEDSPEYIAYQKEIEKKKAELKIMKKEMLPQVSLYSGYSIYGTNKSNFATAISDMAQSNLSVGLTAGMPLLEPIKAAPRVKELELEIQSLEIRQAQKIAEFQKDVNKTKQTLALYKSEAAKNLEFSRKLNEQLADFEKLDSERLISKIDLYMQKIKNNQQNTELEIMEQRAYAAGHKLRFLMEDRSEANQLVNNT